MRHTWAVDPARQRRIALLAIAFALASVAAAIGGATAVLSAAEPPTIIGSWGPDLFDPHPVWTTTAEGASGSFTWRHEQTTDGACWRLFVYEATDPLPTPRELWRRAECGSPLQDPGVEAGRLADHALSRAQLAPPAP